MLIRYYDVKVENTVSLGDGFNDVPMFKIANVSVAMGNSTKDIKRYATVKINKTNKEGGVGWYINKFLDNPQAEINKSNEKRYKRSQAEEE